MYAAAAAAAGVSATGNGAANGGMQVSSPSGGSLGLNGVSAGGIPMSLATALQLQQSAAAQAGATAVGGAALAGMPNREGIYGQCSVYV